MARSSITDPTGDLGRQLTIDVASLALSMPVIARDTFSVVVLPFVFAASLTLVVLFLTPFRDIPFIAQHATHNLNSLRMLTIVAAGANLVIGGYGSVQALSMRWLLSVFIAVTALGILSIDLRRVFAN